MNLFATSGRIVLVKVLTYDCVARELIRKRVARTVTGAVSLSVRMLAL
jgi:hypothetical protein